MMLIKNCYTEVIHIHHSYLENVGEYILLHNIIFDPNVQRKLLLTPWYVFLIPFRNGIVLCSLMIRGPSLFSFYFKKKKEISKSPIVGYLYCFPVFFSVSPDKYLYLIQFFSYNESVEVGSLHT